MCVKWKVNTHTLYFCLKMAHMLEYISTYSHNIKEGRIPIKLLSEVASGEWERKGRLDYFVKNVLVFLQFFLFLWIFESLKFHLFKISKYLKICIYFLYGYACVCLSIWVCTTCVCRNLWKSESRAWCELLCGCWEVNLGPLAWAVNSLSFWAISSP